MILKWDWGFIHMPHFRAPVIRNQPIIKALVFESRGDINEQSISANTNTFKALVDTGATHSVISTKVVQRLGLISIGKRTVVSASHSVDANTYQAVIGIPIVEMVDPIQKLGQIHSRFFVQQVTEMPSLGTTFDLLIGMDIIQQCVLVVHQDMIIFSY